MANEKRLIEELREMADRTPPICQFDKPHNVEIFGNEITVYCKPFEQFQELLRRAADALSVDAVEVVHSWWEKYTEGYRICHHCKANVAIFSGHKNYCPNCGAKMDGDGNG